MCDTNYVGLKVGDKARGGTPLACIRHLRVYFNCFGNNLVA